METERERNVWIEYLGLRRVPELKSKFKFKDGDREREECGD